MPATPAASNTSPAMKGVSEAEMRAIVTAAPVPKSEMRAKIESKFGKMVDPKADSKFELDNDALKITLPAKEDRR